MLLDYNFIPVIVFPSGKSCSMHTVLLLVFGNAVDYSVTSLGKNSLLIDFCQCGYLFDGFSNEFCAIIIPFS